MPQNSQVIDRRIHRHYLSLGVIDASQNSAWRRKLFAAPLYHEHPIDSNHTAGLLAAVVRGIVRYSLEYVVCRVPVAPPPFEKLGWAGCEFFRFAARRYPDIVSVTANNPDLM